MNVRRSLLPTLVGLSLAFCTTVVAEEQPSPPPQAAAEASFVDVDNDTCDLLYLHPSGPLLLRLHVRIDGRSARAVWKEGLDRTFADLDENGSGVLEPSEAARIGKDKPPDQSGAERRSADVNPADGVVTKAELAEYLRPSESGPFWHEVYRVRDTNPQDTASGRLFALLDRDRDRRLSKQELRSAKQTLRRLDVNDDEVIAESDLRPDTQASYVLAIGGATPPPAAAMEAAKFLSPDTSDTSTLARSLLEFYDGGRPEKQQPDKQQRVKKDARLDATEIALPEAVFHRLDANADQHLDAEELATLAGSLTPEVELIARLGERGAAADRVEIVRSDDRRQPARIVSRTTAGSPTVELGGALFLIGASGRQSRVDERLTKRIAQLFKELDRNSNGYLEKQEADNYFPQNTGFELADRDGDGKVFEKELTNLIVAQIEGSRGRTAIQIGQQGPQLFAMLDHNGDSRLSARELDQSARVLARWDANRDGLVALEELPDHFGISIYPSAPPIARQFTLGYTYSSNDAPSPDERGPLWFRKMDRNRDRDVSRREFLGPLDDFASFDTDGDGRIDPAEAEAVSRESLAP